MPGRTLRAGKNLRPALWMPESESHPERIEGQIRLREIRSRNLLPKRHRESRLRRLTLLGLHNLYYKLKTTGWFATRSFFLHGFITTVFIEVLTVHSFQVADVIEGLVEIGDVHAGFTTVAVASGE